MRKIVGVWPKREPIVYRAVLPEEPPIGTVLLDQADGVVWQRVPDAVRPSAWARPYEAGELGSGFGQTFGLPSPWKYLAPGRTLIELYRPEVGDHQ